MVKRKPVRTRGKFSFSRYFQKLNKGDFVSIVRERAFRINFPESLQGRTGIVEGKQGRAYIIKLNGVKKDKKYLIAPIHLRKIQVEKK